MQLGLAGGFLSQQTQTVASSAMALPYGPWRSLLDAGGVTSPDGRALHAYRFAPDAVRDLRALLRQRGAAGFDTASRETAAFFVLWASSWFQASHTGGVRRWEDVAEALGAPLEASCGRRLTEEGLSVWRRPPVRGEAARLWLRTLAVEGGLPAGVLRQGGWVGDYLARLVASLLAGVLPEGDDLVEAASRHADAIPMAYRQEIFYAVAGALAAAVVALRREVTAEPLARGMPASAWLEASRPTWRNALPIALDDASSRRLIDDLMKVEPVSALSGRVMAVRLLARDGEVWRPALRIDADGVLPRPIAAGIAGAGDRLRVFPTGALARHVSGEVGVLEAPYEGDGWRARPSRRDMILRGVPFEAAATVEFRLAGRAVGEGVWPGGEAERGELLVFAEQGPDMLALIGAGSGAHAEEHVVIATPAGWRIEAAEGGAVDDFGSATGGRRMWRVTGAAVARSPEGDARRVVARSGGVGCERLDLVAARPEGMESLDPTVDLICGLAQVRGRRDERIVDLKFGEFGWRPVGERNWRETRLPFEPVGLVDLAWLATEPGFVRATARVFVLPLGAALARRNTAEGVVYRWSAFGGAVLGSGDPALSLDHCDGAILARASGRAPWRARLLLKSAIGPALAVAAPFLRKPGLSDARGGSVPPSRPDATRRLSLSALRACVAFGEGRHILRAAFLGAALSDAPPLEWIFDGELALAGVADELGERLWPLAHADDVGADLTLDDHPERWRVGCFEAALGVMGRHFALSGVEDDVDVIGRCFERPGPPRKLARWTLADRLNRRDPPSRPTFAAGGWCILSERRKLCRGP